MSKTYYIRANSMNDAIKKYKRMTKSTKDSMEKPYNLSFAEWDKIDKFNEDHAGSIEFTENTIIVDPETSEPINSKSRNADLNVYMNDISDETLNEIYEFANTIHGKNATCSEILDSDVSSYKYMMYVYIEN